MCRNDTRAEYLGQSEEEIQERCGIIFRNLMIIVWKQEVSERFMGTDRDFLNFNL